MKSLKILLLITFINSVSFGQENESQSKLNIKKNKIEKMGNIETVKKMYEILQKRQ